MTGLIATHWVLGGIVCSLVWIAAGWQSLSNQAHRSALLWLFGATVTTAALAIWSFKAEEWLGLIAALSLLTAAIVLLRKSLRAGGADN